MLQVKNIQKIYKTNGFSQRALNNVSLNFRENEFVAILGPSGSGKTTLLNILGGLDKYDNGDIIINGVSTKKYKDKDWDSYRNHSIGFVFQSYNLIPHQSILSNVELALTISGLSKRERKAMARESLERVGLGNHIHKLPNQLSGGQMQRVAIARALVNNPTILLADEPTGALDSNTSVQIMNLLQEVASDRLVIMVTHNPELAKEYATRIIELKDGEIVSDSNPVFSSNENYHEAVHQNMGKSSMSFLTALSLSFKNLLTKKARTILVAIAGSIGIIGIALILSISNGVNNYIADIEENTLSEYPVELSSNSFSLEGLFSRNTQEEQNNDTVTEISLLTNIFTKLSTNDLKGFKDYIESDSCDLSPYANHIEYKYDITPLIYNKIDNNIRQVNPYDVMSIFDNDITSLYSGFSSFSISATEVFHELPSSPDLYKKQYQIEAGRWPQSYNECILVLTSNGAVSDLMLFACGIKDDTPLKSAMNNYQSSGSLYMESADTENDDANQYHYSDFLEQEFKLVLPSDCYVYDDEYDVWTSKFSNANYMNRIFEESDTLRLVGIVKPVDGSSSTMLQQGIYYPHSLTEYIIQMSQESELVQAQINSPDIDVLTGNAFSSDETVIPDLSALFDIDEDKMKDAFRFNQNLNSENFMPENIDLSSAFDTTGVLNNIDFNQIDFALPNIAIDSDGLDFSNIDIPEISQEELLNLLQSVNIQFTDDELFNIANEIQNGYLSYAQEFPEGDITKLPDSVTAFLSTDTAKDLLKNGINDILSSIPNTLTIEKISDTSNQIAAGFPSWAETYGYNNIEHYHEDITAYLLSEYVLSILRDGLSDFLTEAILNISDADIESILQGLNSAYNTYAQENLLPNSVGIQTTLSNYLNSDEFFTIINNNVVNKIDVSNLELEIQQMLVNFIASQMSSFSNTIVSSYSDTISASITNAVSQQMSGIINEISKQLETSISSYMEEMLSQFTNFDNFSDMIDFDADVFKEAISANFDQSELSDMLSSFFSSTSTTLDGNLKKFGFADIDSPSSILIYPKSFNDKGHIVELIDTYNEQMLQNGKEEKVIEFTDMVGTLMSSITTIIDAISYVLIAFVSVSLIVSSIMIGVITYISVLERRKEIGILRSLGASKHNVSNVFNAETIITGFLSGVIGISFTYFVMLPGNAILRNITGQENLVAYLPPKSALFLILLSIFLTFIGGLIPSRKAAHSDPVTALRTE